jgi:cytolysin (calcineurin-like family phosphatase)
LLDVLKPYNVAGIFHGHEHDAAMIYNRGGYDLFKPTAAFTGGFGVARVTEGFMDVALGEATDDDDVRFLKAMSKQLA